MTFTPHVPARDTRSSTLSIVSLALAIVLPPIGLVLGLIARVKSKTAGTPTLVATAAAVIGAILSIVWSVAIALLLGAAVSSDGEQLPESPAAPSSQPDSPAPSGGDPGDVLVFEVTAEEDLDATTLAAASTALAAFAEAAGMEVVEVTKTDSGALSVIFDADVSSADISAFARAVSDPAAEGFFAVSAVHPASGGADPGDGSSTPPCQALRFGPLAVDGAVLACDEAMLTQLLLPPTARVSGESIAEVEVSGDIVAVTLDTASAVDFAEWTREAAAAPAPGNQIALVDFMGIISAPQVGGELTGGEFQISGASMDAELLASRLVLLSVGVSFSAMNG